MLSFEQWLKLSNNEEALKEDIELLIQKKDFIPLSHQLAQLDLDLFIKLTENSSSLNQFCESHPDAIKALCLSHLQERYDFDPTQLFPSLTPYKMLKGNFFFEQACDVQAEMEEEFTKEEMPYLHKSVENHSFHALYALLTYNISQIEDGASLSKDDFLNPARFAAFYYFTPGYLLLFTAYMNWGDFNKDEESYFNAHQALITAQNLSNTPESLKAIHYAYCGNGLLAGAGFKFKSWEEAFLHVESFLPKQAEQCKYKLTC